MQGLRRDAQAVAGRLLRVLLLRHSALSTRADWTLRRVSRRDRDWVKTIQGYKIPNKAIELADLKFSQLVDVPPFHYGAIFERSPIE